MLLLLLVSCFVVVFFCFKLLLLPLVVNKDDYKKIEVELLYKACNEKIYCVLVWVMHGSCI